jgi:hypothetical protein
MDVCVVILEENEMSYNLQESYPEVLKHNHNERNIPQCWSWYKTFFEWKGRLTDIMQLELPFAKKKKKMPENERILVRKMVTGQFWGLKHW